MDRFANVGTYLGDSLYMKTGGGGGIKVPVEPSPQVVYAGGGTLDTLNSRSLVQDRRPANVFENLGKGGK